MERLHKGRVAQARRRSRSRPAPGPRPPFPGTAAGRTSTRGRSSESPASTSLGDRARRVVAGPARRRSRREQHERDLDPSFHCLHVEPRHDLDHETCHASLRRFSSHRSQALTHQAPQPLPTSNASPSAAVTDAHDLHRPETVRRHCELQGTGISRGNQPRTRWHVH